MADRNLTVRFLGDSADLEKDFKRVSRELARSRKQLDSLNGQARKTDSGLRAFGRSGGVVKRGLRDIGHGAAYALGAGGFGGGMYALFDITKKSIGEFRESERVSRQTAAALKSTGGAAGVTSKQVSDLATALSRKTGIDDEAIQSGENLLLTFTKIRNETGKGNDIFNRATKTVQDMSVALGQDTKSSAIQLGKALNDPIRGITALRRVGVSFTTDQQKQIKSLVAHGKTLEAQKLILRELGTEFGGSAEKQATAGKKLSVTLGNVAENIGSKLAPTLNDAATKANKFLNEMMDGTGAGGRFAAKMRAVADDVGKVVRVAKDVAKFLVKHPALLAAAGAAWVTYKAAALTQIAIVKAAELGLFGTGMKTKLATEAGKTGTTVGKNFALKAGAAAAAGVAGWEIGGWLRKKSPAVRDAGDALGTQLGEAIFGGSKLQSFVDRYVDQIQHKIDDALNGLKSTVGNVGKIGNKAFQGVTGKKVTPKRGPKRIVKTSSVGNTGIVARASGEAGGQELSSLQSALAWVRAHYPGLYESMIENQGGSNQHLHIASGQVVAIGKALQAMGYSVAENPAFGGVHSVHVPGSYHYKGLAIDVNSDYRSIRAGGAAPGGGSTPSSGPSPVARAKQEAAKRLAAARRLAKKRADEARKRKLATEQARRQALRDYHDRGGISAAKGFRVDRTIDNPILQAALSHYDNLAYAGQLSEVQANALKTGVLQTAIPGLRGENALIAQGMIRDLAPGGGGSFRDVIEQTLSNYGLSARAGDLTDAQAVEKQIQTIRENLGNAGLTDQDRLELRAELGDLTKALKDNTASNQEQVDLLKQQRDEARRRAATSDATSSAILDWFHSQMSQRSGQAIAGRGLGGGYGLARRS